jgi:hypothetical protein
VIPAGARLQFSIVAILAAGCVTTPHHYRYRPTLLIATPDWGACHTRADAPAQQRCDRYLEIVEATGPFDDPFGGVTLAQKAWDEREADYAREMTECPAARGHEVGMPAPERDSR